MTQTLTVPHIGTDDKEFLKVRRMAQRNKQTIHVTDHARRLLGSFNTHGDFSEAPTVPLQISLWERMMDSLNIMHDSVRQRRSKLATMRLLMTYEQQLKAIA